MTRDFKEALRHRRTYYQFYIYHSLYIPRFITVCCIYIIKTNKKGRTFGKNSKYLNKTLLFCFNLRNFRLA